MIYRVTVCSVDGDNYIYIGQSLDVALAAWDQATNAHSKMDPVEAGFCGDKIVLEKAEYFGTLAPLPTTVEEWNYTPPKIEEIWPLNLRMPENMVRADHAITKEFIEDIQQKGFVTPVTIDSENRIVDGVRRVLVAVLLERSVPVKRV